MSNREAYNIRVLGQDLYDKVSSSKILLIGAGGIGCELLKNLVMSGFKNIEVIDLDTIDVSNLNRQFLFQKQHVKKSKAHVAKETAHKFNPSVKISSLQANIKEPQFSVEWFKQFTIVLNALDNLDARRHVNAMCLVAKVPLVESGTQGYFGQAYVIKKNESECFDCQPKVAPKTYPVCTIRSTPSEPIHCIVWAKSFLFSQLFGNSEDEEAIEEDQSQENAQEVAALKKETEELKAIKDAAGSPNYTEMIFSKVFKTDVDRLLSMEDMWKNRKKPTPLVYSELEAAVAAVAAVAVAKKEQKAGALADQKVWDLKENFDMFKDSVTRLSTRLLEARETKSDTILTFDKDDDDAMDFVTAASNLRAYVFGIEKKSLFDVKSMAGNIIPAIATTNAVIAGVVILKAFGILRNNIKNNPRIYLATGSRLLSEPNAEPNPNCSVCQSRSATVQVDFENATLNDVLEKAILLPIEDGGAGMEAEEVAILEGTRLLYDIDFDDNLNVSLKGVGIRPGSILRFVNDNKEEVDLIMETLDTMIERDQVVKLLDAIPKPQPQQQKLKRKLEEEQEQEQEERNKKPKIAHTVVDNVVILDLDSEEDDEDIALLD